MRMKRVAVLAAVCATVWVSLEPEAAGAQAAARTASPTAVQTSQWDGVYTEEQAARGEPLYRENCSMCHGLTLAGTVLAPALAGPVFTAKWNRRSLSLVFDVMQTRMPLNLSGHLSPQQNADVLAYMLKRGESPAGSRELAPASLAAVIVRSAPAGGVK